jgi:hypothetical protein
VSENDRQSLDTALCATCGQALGEPHAYCGNCDARYCLTCGSRHFCTATCQANGCIAGLCVRLVRDGELSPRWGIPPELIAVALAPSAPDAGIS